MKEQPEKAKPLETPFQRFQRLAQKIVSVPKSKTGKEKRSAS